MSTFLTVRTGLVVDVTGEDRLTFLDDVTSQELRGRRARRWTRALELDPHGAPLAAFDVVLLDDRVRLIAPTPDVARDLVDRLGSRTFLSDARFALTDDAVVSLRGDDARSTARKADLEVDAGWVDPRVGATVLGREDGVDVLVAESEVDDVVGPLVDAGAQPADLEQLSSWQVATGEPRWGHEIVSPHLPEELGLLPTHVHLGKGCYPGQEAVARMWMLGRPRRRLARVRLLGDVDVGWVAGAGRQRVEVTGTSELDGERVGLAFVPSGAERGSRYEADGSAIEVIELVGEGEPVPGHDPDVKRRRDQREA